MDKTSTEDVLNWTVNLAKQAGDVLMAYFGTELTHNIKTHKNDFATEADEASEHLILKAIKDTFPDDAIIAEESGLHKKTDAKYTWIVDPLDGTFHFANGRKNFGVLISRAHGADIDIAVVFSPIRDLLATAIVNQGVFLNGVQVHLNDMQTHDMPIVANIELHKILQPIGDAHSERSSIGGLLKTLQGEYMANVASKGLIWDHAPVALMLSEAGWKVTAFNGSPFQLDGKIEKGHPGIIASPEDMHQRIRDALDK